MNGGIDTISYPSGFAVRQVYTALGYLSQVKDAATGTAYWTANARDAELHLTSATAGNGITTTQTFDPTNGLISAIQAGTSGAVANFSYGWDITTGNLTSRTDANESYTERFCYDGLNRLTDVAMGAGTTCTTGTNHKVMGYDALGNLTSKTGVGTYTYGGGAAGPHAVTSIAGTVNGVVNPTYSYDLNGNMTSGGGRSIIPTAFNMAGAVTQGGTSFCLTYDSSHARVTQTLTTATCIAPGSGAGTTVYANDPVSGAMEEAATVGGVPGWKDYIIAAGTIVAQRSVGASTVPPVWGASTWGSFTWTAGTAATPVVLYVTGDHLGSSSVLTNAAGSVTERDSYDAWGLRRNANGSDAASCTAITSAMTRGFTAQEHIDSVCAINFNARLYDPTLGRFLSADSMVPDPTDSQSFNRYSYVNNGPLSATDLTGHDDSGCTSNDPCIPNTPNPSGNPPPAPASNPPPDPAGNPQPGVSPWSDPKCFVCDTDASMYVVGSFGGLGGLLDSQGVREAIRSFGHWGTYSVGVQAVGDTSLVTSNGQYWVSADTNWVFPSWGGIPGYWGGETGLNIPPSAIISSNIALAKAHAGEYLWFYTQVRGHGPWDYKQLGSNYQNFGNFNYGATGAAAGFSEDTLLRTAGWAQVRAQTSQSNWGTSVNLGEALLGVGGTPPFGDDPNDQMWISRGIDYYNQQNDNAASGGGR